MISRNKLGGRGQKHKRGKSVCACVYIHIYEKEGGKEELVRVLEAGWMAFVQSEDY